MFTAENKNKLIEDLNYQLKTNTFYTPNCSEKVDFIEKNKTMTSSLYRPFLSSDFNPLTKSVYNYSATSSVPVYKIAFEKNSLGSQTLMPKTQKSNSISSKMIFSETQELNVCDIISNTDEASVLNFKAIPKEMALAKISKNRNFWTRDIDILGTVKSIFKK